MSESEPTGRSVVLSTYKNTNIDHNIETKKVKDVRHTKLMKIIDNAKELPTTFGARDMKDILTDEM
jgi:hypothetical protein